MLKRTRTCQTKNKLGQILNVSLEMCGSGESIEELPCTMPACPDLGEWSEWSAWSTCSNDCKQFKKRTCLSSDKKCVGEKTQSKYCNTNPICKEKHFFQNHNQMPNFNNNIKNNNDNIEYELSINKNSNEVSLSDTFKPKQFDMNNNDNLLEHSYLNNKFINNTNLFTISIVSGLALFFLLLLGIILTLIIKNYKKTRKSNKSKSDLNLYYTCEKQVSSGSKHDDECSIFQYTKVDSNSSTSNSSSGTSPASISLASAFKSNKTKITELCSKTDDNMGGALGSIYSNVYELHDSNEMLYHNMEQQKLLALNNIQSQQIYLPANQNNQYQQIFTTHANNMRHVKPKSKDEFIINSNSVFIPISSPSNNKNSSSISTKSIVLSSPNPSNSMYFANDLNAVSSNGPTESYKIITINNIPTLIKATDNDLNNYIILNQKTNQEKLLAKKPSFRVNDNMSQSYLNFHRQQQQEKQIAELQRHNLNNQIDQQELAYEVSDALNINSNDGNSKIKSFLKTNINHQTSTPLMGNKLLKLDFIDGLDICCANVTNSGARLTLDCGISMIVPEGAILNDQNVQIYLAINRMESCKPNLNEKNLLLSEVITIGPANLALSKPVILLMDHCVNKVDKDWDIKLHKAFNWFDETPLWNEEPDLESNYVHLSSVGNYFIMMTDKLGRYCIVGEPRIKSNKFNSKQKSSKYYRLVTFCSNSITNDEFSIRVYCIDNLIFALQVSCII
jgi:hypothetical protein